MARKPEEKPVSMAGRLSDLPPRVLAWYDRAARDLPWRVGPVARRAGAMADPYRVWLSEIMLQQTTVPHGARYFETFTTRWPSVEALAGARDEDVMAAWAGLGYYARARNLLKCARVVVARGGFPRDEAALRDLPGIGPYTAGAIAAIAFGQPAPAVDGNVERVFSRLLAAKGAWSDEKKAISRLVASLVPRARPGEFAEALMDLGATLCTPRSPDCAACPLADLCLARREGRPERYPVKPVKSTRPHRYGAAFVLFDRGEVMLVQRPDSGLLGGMLGLPGTDWTSHNGNEPLAAARAFAGADWSEIGSVRHVFTHFSLDLIVVAGALTGQRLEGRWTRMADVSGLPSVFDKAFRLAAADLRASR